MSQRQRQSKFLLVLSQLSVLMSLRRRHFWVWRDELWRASFRLQCHVCRFYQLCDQALCCSFGVLGLDANSENSALWDENVDFMALKGSKSFKHHSGRNILGKPTLHFIHFQFHISVCFLQQLVNFDFILWDYCYYYYYYYKFGSHVQHGFIPYGLYLFFMVMLN